MSRLGVLLLGLAMLAGCAPASESPATPEQAAPATANAAAEDPTVLSSAPQDTSVAAAGEPGFVPLLAVGDVASCDTTGDEKVAQLAREREGRIAILGDAVYDNATAKEFRGCFNPAWGPMAQRLRPSLGNHDVRTDDGQPYFDYFGDWAGRPGQGWYAYNAGDHWRIIALNSNCSNAGGCGSTSPQGRWLAKAIAAAGDRHILAYWHAPLYSSGQHGPNASVKPLYRMLYRGGADVVLNGHDHTYERFAPQDAEGNRRSNGIQQFVAGTGGFKHYAFNDVLPNSRVRDNTSFGLLKLRLKANGYSWTFIPSEGDFTDSGSRTLD